MLFPCRAFILRWWQKIWLLQRCNVLRARGFRVRRRGQLLLISGGRRYKRSHPRRRIYAGRKCRPAATVAVSQATTLVSLGARGNTRPYR